MIHEANSLANTFTILIADRNPEVRKCLRRVLVAEGYHVWIARDTTEVLMILKWNDPPDLLILDQDTARVNRLGLSKRFEDHYSPMPVVVHDAAPFLEESATNVDGFKALVAGVLREWYRDRFKSLETQDCAFAEEDRLNQQTPWSGNRDQGRQL
jgi:CheY-like chemotaxis protein